MILPGHVILYIPEVLKSQLDNAGVAENHQDLQTKQNP